MEQRNQPQAQRDCSTSFVLPQARSSPDPLENPASQSPRPYRIERLRDVYENLSCTDEDTDTTADAIALNDLNASQPAPAGPCTNDSSTSTNAKDSSETMRTSTSIRSRIGRLFAQAQPSTQSTSRLRLLPNISVSRLSFLRRDRGSSSSISMPNTRTVYSSDGRALFEYDPYTVRGTTPPLAGPFDFSLTSQESRFWRPGQGEQRRLRAGSEGSQLRSQRSQNPGVGPARNDGGLSSYGYEREYGCGYAYGQGQRRGEWGTAAAAAAQREREPNANSSSRPRGGSGSGSVQIQSPPRIHGPAPRRRRADSTMTTAMINEESRSGEQPHASSSHVLNRSRSRSVIPSPSSSVYSDGSDSINDTCSSMGCPCCSRRNDDEEADKADRANNDDTGGSMVLDGPADDDPTPWPRETRPQPGRTDSYASSLARLRWEASKPGSPYPSPFRPGLATLTLKRQRERREAKQRAQQAAAEEERKTRRRSVSASAALMSAAEEDDDGAYAAALASLDNPRSASASALLMDGDDADDDGAYAAALADMPVPMFVPPETDEIVVGAIEALRDEYEEGARKQRSRRLAKLKQDLQNKNPRARGGADSSAKKKLFRMTW